MSVLELSDESRIIREAAKAWARGDIPLGDYRMIRRATLDGLCGTVSEDEPGGDDTAPNDDTEVVDPTSVGSPPARKNLPLIIGGVVLLAVAGALVFTLMM